MADEALEVKRRFDDVYRALLVIGPVLSFSFSNYAPIDVLKNFVTNIGYPALMTAIILWAVPHLMRRNWEYHVKFAGYVLIWFTFLVLAAIVYIGRDPRSAAFYLVAVGMTLIVIFLTGRMLTRTNVVSGMYGLAMLILTVLLGAISLPLVLPT